MTNSHNISTPNNVEYFFFVPIVGCDTDIELTNEVTECTLCFLRLISPTDELQCHIEHNQGYKDDWTVMKKQTAHGIIFRVKIVHFIVKQKDAQLSTAQFTALNDQSVVRCQSTGTGNIHHS